MTSNYDFLYLSFGEQIDVSSCQVKPTVCLMIVDHFVEKEMITAIVRDAVLIGCTFFMTWGSKANTLHDTLDEIIENGSDDWLNIITTSHEGEPLSDVLDFLFTGALPNNHTFRCLVIGDKPVDELRSLCYPV